MEYNINLQKEEWNYILEAIQHFENKSLKEILKTLENMRYEDVQELFVSEEFFTQYKKERIDTVKKQIATIENIYDKITDEIE